MVSDLAKGKTLEEAMKITPESVVNELDGLPTVKHHCSNLGAQALHAAIENYREKQKAGGQKNG
jgi:nitrogen fixation NifU-like protein